MHPHDPYQHQQPHQPQYPPQPPPVVYVQQPSNKAATVGIWVIVAWVVGPAVLIALCCLGCFGTGLVGSFMEGFNEGVSGVSSTPSP
jgi:hypothetical protein